MTATLFLDPLATAGAPATKAAATPEVSLPSFMAPMPVDPQDHRDIRRAQRDIRRAQRDHAEKAKNDLAAELAAALAGTKLLRTR
jgi:hypothetical protein